MSKGCKIVKSKSGKITAVNNQQGEKSTLFQQILNVPSIALNEAIEMYKGIYSDKLKGKVQFQIIGQKGAQNLDQIEEATFRMDNLKVAREMEKALGLTDNYWQTKGAKQDEKKRVLLTTGWQKGADLTWKYEILDGTFKDILVKNEKKVVNIKDAYKYPITSVFDNQELFNAVPQIKNTEVIFFIGNENQKNLSMVTDSINIFINLDYYGLSTSDRFFSEDERRAHFLHELQHLSQGFEGFQRGSNPETESAGIIEYFNKLRGQRNQGLAETESDRRFKEFLQESVNKNNDIFLEKNIDKIINNEELSRITAILTGIDMYNKFMGETESRNVETRMNMSAEERRQTLLEETEDVTREDQIFIMDNLGGSQMSYSPQKSSERITQEIIDKLKQTRLSEDVQLLSTEEINKRLEELGVSEEVRKQVIAWHGSPYSFDRFTTNAMGTGEGAQAFGWGLYFTDLEGIARSYATSLTQAKSTKRYKYEKSLEEALNNKENIEYFANGGADYKIIYNNEIYSIGFDNRNRETRLEKPYILYDGLESLNKEEVLKEIISIIKKDNKKGEFQIKGDVINLRAEETVSLEKNLYKVSLHKGRAPSEYVWLEHDKPITEEIKRIFEKSGFIWDFEKIPLRQGQAYAKFTSQLNEDLKDRSEAQKQVSLLLLKNGIDGVKYPAESISRGATSDTARGFNYVVFDENAITIEEQIQFSKSLNNVGINLITNGFTYKDKTGKDIVVLNKDTATDETAVHEFSHIFSKWQKQNKPELWKKGQELVKNAIENNEIQEIADYVKQTQPNLTEGSEAFYDEVLQEFIGRESKNMMDEQKQKSPLMQWLSDFWASIKDLFSLTSMTPEQVANLSLRDFARASVVDLLSGERITQDNIQQAIQRNNGNPLNLAPNGKPSILYQSYKDLGYSEQETERLTAQVYSNSFLDFFGDWLNDAENSSKVVDKNGQPLVVYHGTSIKFNEFRKGKELILDSAIGSHFAKDKQMAENIVRRDFGRGEVREVFLNIRNSQDFLQIDESNGEYDGDIIRDYVFKQVFNANNELFERFKKEAKGVEYVDNIDNALEYYDYFDSSQNTKFRILTKDVGDFYNSMPKNVDGIIYKNTDLNEVKDTKDATSYITFNPNQIKSATENVGTFSTESNDIRYQIIGEQGASRIEEYGNLLNQAKELEKQGKDYSQTGWYKTNQGQWKYLSNEILNEFLDFPQIKNKTIDLKDLLKPNSLLLQAYPQLENTKIEFYEGTEGTDFRADANTNGTIIQNGDETTLHIRTDSKTKPDVRRIVAHELNHKIQSIENFPRGGRPESFLKFANQITGIELTNDFQDYKNKMLSFDGNILSKEDRGIVKILQDYLKNDRNSKDYFYDKYLLLQGEIDSRAVELALTLKDIYGTQQNFSYINIVKALAKQENNPSIIDQTIDLFYEDINTTSQTKVVEPQPNFNGYPTYKEAVDNTPLNEDIEIRIDDVVLGSVNANNEINDLVRQGIIEDKRELQPNGDIVFVTTGTNLESKIISGLIAKEVLGGIVNKAGDVRVKQKVAAPEVFDTFEKNKKEYGEYDALSLLAAEELEKNTSAFGVERFITEEIDIPSETVLMSKLKNLLNQLGVKTMNLDAWEKRFGQKANSNALADIANRIVAFAEGNFNIDTLSEETSHFIIEALDQETLKPLLDLIHKTEEWKEYSQTYMEIYNGNEALVRKEILGKVLKNSLQNRVKQQETLQGQSVVDRIVQYFNEFIESVRNLFTEDYKKQLKQFNDEIYEKLISEELFNELNPQQFEGNKIVMYQTQLSDTVVQSISKFKDRMIIEDRKVGGLHQISLNNVTIDEYDEVAQLEAIATLASIMKKHIEFLNKRGKKQGFLSVNEHSVYDATIELGAILQNIVPKISDKTSYIDKERALKSSNEALSELSNLTANLNNEKVNKFKEIIERVAEENNLSQQQKDVLLKEIQTQERDANQFYVWFGGAINAQNPIVNMLAKLFRKMNNETTATFSKEVNEFFSKIGGVKQEEVAGILKTFKRGNYLFSPYKFDDFLRDESKIRLEVYKQVDPETYNTISKDVENKEEDFLKNYNTYKKALRGEYYNKYRLLTKEAIDKAGIKIDALSKEGRKEYLDMFNSLNLSEETRIILQLNKDRKAKIIQEQKRNGGASAEDNQQLKEIQIEYSLDTNPYDSNGELYKGLDIVDGNVVLAEGYTKEKLKEDALLKKEKPKALIALELNEYSRALTQFYSGKGKSVFEGFYNMAERNLDIAELNNFIDLNTRAFFTQEFWQTKDESLVKKLRDLNTEESLKLAKDIEKKNNKLKNVLKKNKLYNRPSEINFDSMNSADISEVKDLSTHLEADYNSAKKLLNKEEFKTESDKKYTTRVNEAYLNELKERGINGDNFQQLLPFLNEHTTNQSYNSILRMKDKISKYAGSGVIKGLNATEEELQSNPNEVLIKYAHSKLLPYFKATEAIDNPYGRSLEFKIKEEYASAIREKKGYQELERIYERFKKEHLIDVSPNFIFEDVENSDRLNPEYKRRIENNEPLINLEAKDKNGKLLYKNQEFFDHFGITNFGDVATKNQEEYKIWEALMEMHEKTLGYTNKSGKHNKYLLPQYRRGLLARAKDTAKNFSVDKLKESLKDVLTYREDDPMLGMTKDGVAQSYSKTDLIIPRTGFNLLDSKEEVTDELLYSYMLMLQEGIKYQKRTEAWSEVEAMEHFLKSKKYGDKIGEKTKVYDLFKGFVNDNLYGQRETFDVQTDAFGLLSKKQSVAPVLNLFQKFIRLNNLAFSVLTPMTSFLQGSTNYFIEKYLGDRIDKDAARLARKDLPKLLTEAMSEFLDVKANAKLNLLFQFMGQESPTERFKNSNSGKVARLLNLEKSGYFTHYVAGVPLDAKIMLTTLNDFRIVDNSVMDFYTFRRKNRGMTNAEVRAAWKNYEDNTLYKNLEFDEKTGSFKPSKNLENIPNYQNAIQKARDKVTLAKLDIDNQLTEGDKGIMARHALLSFFTLHKGWLITSITKRWKSTHLNMLNGRMEEGSHSGALKFVTGFVKDIIKKDKDGKRRTLTEAWKENFKEYDGGYKLRKDSIVDENNVEVANITKMTDLRISGNKIYSKATYKGNNWSNLQEVSVDIVNDKYVTNIGVEITSDSVEEVMKDYFEELKYDFSEMRKLSVRRAFIDYAVASVLASLGILLSQMADDDEDDFVKEAVAYASFRLASEFSSQSVALPAQAYAFLESPTVGMSQLQNSLDVLDVFDGDEINRGTFKGLSKREAWFIKMLPGLKEYNKISNIDRTRQSYEFFNEKNLKWVLPAYQMLSEEKKNNK